MQYEDLRQAVEKAVKQASGCKMQEAVAIITSTVADLVLKPAEDTFAIISPELVEPEIPPSVIRPTSKITTLKPVLAAPPRSIVKEVWTADQVQQFIENETPMELSFVPDGTDKEARLTRIVTVDTNKPPTIQLSYRPSSNDPDIPYPKYMLFTTDEGWDWVAILAKLAKDASSMYRNRTTPIVTHKISTGGRVIFSNKAEV